MKINVRKTILKISIQISKNFITLYFYLLSEFSFILLGILKIPIEKDVNNSQRKISQLSYKENGSKYFLSEYKVIKKKNIRKISKETIIRA